VYVEKKPGFDLEARRLQAELAMFLGSALAGLRILQRYDVAGLTREGFGQAVQAVFAEPSGDQIFLCEAVPGGPKEQVFGVEFLPGQYDQRRNSAEECIELILGVKPAVRTARIFLLRGDKPLSERALNEVKGYLINPVDSREASLALPDSLEEPPPEPQDIPILTGFSRASPAELAEISGSLGLTLADLLFCQGHFAALGRDPTLAELRILGVYWSDHCRHSTFTTALDIEVSESLGRAFDLYERARKAVYSDPPPYSLMDLATIGAKFLKKQGLLPDGDESKEMNAAAIKIRGEFKDSPAEDWLLLFKNETHNHPTEIEPFGGAATCLGGAIRDPLSGRAYGYQALRISGGGDPRQAWAETLPGKVPQLKLARESARGFSSYGNQIGIATGLVAEFYHPGFIAKRLELGAVIGAVPAGQVQRASPRPGDAVILVGGKTGRDGIGGATGSSQVHTNESVRKSGAEVQKGNPVEERKLQRLFRNPQAAKLIKRCNDFGAGGAAVAVGELAPGVEITLEAMPKKYAGLDGLELAISESQERLAVVVSPEHTERFIHLAAQENLEATVLAKITDGDEAEPESYSPKDPDAGPHLRFLWRGKVLADLSRQFLNSNGPARSAKVRLPSFSAPSSPEKAEMPLPNLIEELGSLRSGSRRGLQERFDGSIGGGSVLFPFGGAEQGTPECGMAALLPSLEKESLTASLGTFGYDLESNPYEAGKGAVREALAKFACLGGNPWKCRLSLQEYFPRPESPEAWGLPGAALLGALEAQLRLEVPAIGGKDSMSGTYRGEAGDWTVPPTLIAFGMGTLRAEKVRSGALTGAPGMDIILLHQSGAEEWEVFKKNMNTLIRLGEAGLVRAAYPVGPGGLAPTLAVMAFGNLTGVEVLTDLGYLPRGSVLAELQPSASGEAILASAGAWVKAAETLAEPVLRLRGETFSLAALREIYESPLGQVYPQTSGASSVLPVLPRRVGRSHPRIRFGLPLTILPVFPGTNCEWDLERAFRRAGGKTRMLIFRNRTREDLQESLRELAQAIGEAQIIALAGGFSAGDEPDGSGKFIANVLRSPAVQEAVLDFLENRKGLILGICNGFQALIKTGLVPYGEYRPGPGPGPTLTFNHLGRHISRMVRTTVMSTVSPWLALEEVGAVHILPVSHGEGRLVIDPAEGAGLFQAGQVPFCYADAQGNPAGTEPDNPNGSALGIEALASPEGRILGKMAHSERFGEFVHINIPGNKHQRIFEAGIRYFS
jgi:phosphoribosylformylglycinamidine synthase